MSDDSKSDKTTPAQKRPRVGAVEDGEVLAERYRLIRFISAGGMGEVWEAEDLSLHEHVALKTIRPEALDGDALQRFRTEVKLARRVAHRNVCRVFEFGEHARTTGEKVSFLTMELLRGLPLVDVIRRKGRLPAAEALPMLEQLAAGLDAAHQVGIVHRDFKSPNVFLEEGHRLVITDFGLARALESDVRLTQSKAQMMGTPGYMAPEQVEGRDAGPAADVWALGVVAFELVTGELPFTGDTALAVALKRLTEKPRSARQLVPELPKQWDQALAVALARQPEHRFKSAADFVTALRSEATTAALRPLASRRSVKLPVLLGLGALGLASVAAVAFRSQPAPAPTPLVLPRAELATKPIEASGKVVIRRNEAKKWVIVVPVPSNEDAGTVLGLTVVVARSGFFIAGAGGILSGLPNEEGGGMDYGALSRTLAAVKNQFPGETQLVVVCESGVTRGACDLSRMTAAEGQGDGGLRVLFPDQWLVEGEFEPGLLDGDCTGTDLRFDPGARMPARRLTADGILRLKELYGR